MFEKWRNCYCDVFHVRRVTNADLSDKTESATSLAAHVFFSFDVNLEFGGPIWIKNRKKHIARKIAKRSSLMVSR